MKTLVFATNNSHKLDEARQILGSDYTILSLNDIGCHEDIPETADTLEGNSLLKAQYVSEKYHCDCFADDTGLEVAALNGEPGVKTARYASDHDPAANRRKLLTQLSGKDNREAQFRTAVTLIIDGRTYQCEGIVKGQIATEERGDGGFGYDSLFVPHGYDKTFAQLPAATKNSISHRARALQQMSEFFNAHSDDLISVELSQSEK